MMQWYMQFFSLVLCLLMTQRVCQASSGCPTPTEDKEISICSYCSDSRAGVRWAVHPSTLNKYPDGPYRLIISFRCNHTQNMIDITEDACFNGNFIRRLIYLTEPSVWRWHILGQRLPEGTQCQFTTTVRDGHARTISSLQMSTLCTISSNKSSPVMPATCLSESPLLWCPCQCSDGFKIDERGDVTDSLICRNVDECSQGTHHCSDVNNCVDTEGSYYCRDEPNPTPTGRTATSTSESDSVWNPMHTPTPKCRPINAVNSDAVIPSPGPTTSIVPNCLKGDIPDPQADPMCTTTISVVTTCSTATSTVTRCFSQSV